MAFIAFTASDSTAPVLYRYLFKECGYRTWRLHNLLSIRPMLKKKNSIKNQHHNHHLVHHHHHQEYHHNSPASSSNHLQVTEPIIDNSLSLRVFAKMFHHSLSSSTRGRATGEMFLVIGMMVVMITKWRKFGREVIQTMMLVAVKNRLTLIISNLGSDIKRYI